MKAELSSLVSVQIGYQHRERLEQWSEGNYRFIQIKDFDDHRQLLQGQLFRVTPKRIEERYIVKQGDVLFLSRGHKLFASAVTDPLKDTIAAYYFYILRLETPHLLPEYLAWYINQQPAQAFLETNMRGSYMKMIPKHAIGHLPVEIPSLDTQRRILALNNLRIQEQELVNEISRKRNQLVEHLCLRATHYVPTGGTND